MIAGETTSWWLIQPGMYVQDRNGGVWRVDGRRVIDTPLDGSAHLEFRIVNRAGQVADVARDHDDPVVVMIPTLEEAEAMVRARLPVAAVQRRFLRFEELASGPDTVHRRRHIATHLFEHHGISVSPTADVENGDIAGLLEIHALAHAEPWRIPVPHVHVPAHEL